MKWAPSVVQPYRKVVCCGSRAKARSSGTKIRREQEQVQQEPVEPERERLVESALDRHAAAAGEGGGERQADPDEPQDLAPAQHERERRRAGTRARW